MLRFGEKKVAKKVFYGAKKPIKIWDVNVDNIIISKLVETKTNSKYLIEYLGKAVRPLALILPKVIRYVKAFKAKDRNKDNKLNSYFINEEKLLEKHKTISARIEDLKKLIECFTYV